VLEVGGNLGLAAFSVQTNFLSAPDHLQRCSN
jgi:hypothetical protein